jgi:hypothetical protein
MNKIQFFLILLFLQAGFNTMAQDARYGYQLSFNGSNQYFVADAVSDAVAGSNWTIELWFRPTRNVTYTEAIFAFNGTANRIEVGVGPSSGNKLYIYSPGSSPTTAYGATAISPNTWYHMAIRFNSATRGIDMILNGANSPEVSRTLPVADVVQTGDRFSLAQEWDEAAASGFFAGQIDEVRVWNSVLSTTNIANNQFREIATNSSGLLAYYKMTNNSGTTVTDNTGNGRNGTLVNSVVWQTSTVTKNSNGTLSSNQTITAGNAPNDITLTDAPYSNIQWQQSTNNVSFNNISGAVSSTLSSAQMGTPAETRYYRASLSNGYGTFDLSDVVTVTVQPATLPVTWVFFRGNSHANGIQLQWETSSEINADRFEVEHSLNGTRWTMLEAVQSTGGNNGSSGHQRYQIQHNQPKNGSNYYRIKQIDLDGKFEYSKIIRVEFQSQSVIEKIFPNPVLNGRFYVELIQETEVGIYSPSGQLIKKQKMAAGLQSIDVSGWKKGLYWVKTRQKTTPLIVQ